LCGLVGVAGSIHKKELTSFLRMLQYDTIRGEHSTGVGFVKRDKAMGFYKTTEPGWDFVSDPRFTKKIDTFNNAVLIGHNRYATRGKVSSRNAHPFMHGNILGAHNGTIGNPEDLTEGGVFDVDSEALIHEINAIGLPEAIKKIRGAWALTFYNQKDHTINFLRNDQRPLFIAESEDGQTLFWASEDWMLYGGPVREGVKLKDPFELPADKWFRWEVPEAAKSFGKPFLRDKVVGAPALPATQAYHTSSYWFGSKGRETKNEQTTPAKAGGDVKKPVQEVGSNIRQLPTTYGTEKPRKDHLGNIVNETEYKLIIKCGCSSCGETLLKGERPSYLKSYIEDNYRSKKEWLCPDCTDPVSSISDLDDYEAVHQMSTSL